MDFGTINLILIIGLLVYANIELYNFINRNF
jgi:hypothetical protein